MTVKRLQPIFFFFLGLLVSCQQVPDYILSEEIPPVDKTREAKMLSAFFGLDNALTPKARLIWKKAPGKDGMPIVFSHEIDPTTLDASDFQIKTQQGDVRGVEFVSFKPAVEAFELRTLLLIGEYGEYPDNEPIEVNPFQIADINDNENNIDLCIKEAGVPIFVKADEKIAIDPRDDLNAETGIGVLSRW